MSRLLIVCLACPTKRTNTDLSCQVNNPHKKDCGYYGISQNECEKKGCCWKEECDQNIPWCFYGQEDSETFITENGNFCLIDRELREECGYYGIDKKECEERGCCWKVDEENSAVPWCFHSLLSHDSQGKSSIIFDPA